MEDNQVLVVLEQQEGSPLGTLALGDQKIPVFLGKRTGRDTYSLVTADGKPLAIPAGVGTQWTDITTITVNSDT